MDVTEKEKICRQLAKKTCAWLDALVPDPRLIIILGAAKADNLLIEILQKFTLHSPGGSDPLFDSDRALGTFSARTLAAYRLGLIDRDTELYLQKIRRLRNNIAHAESAVDISKPPYSDMILALKSSCLKSSFNEEFEAIIRAGAQHGEELMSLEYVVAVGVCLLEIIATLVEPTTQVPALGWHKKEDC